MERVELLIVEDAFHVTNPVILTPDFAVPEGWKNQTETIVVATPDGRHFEVAADFSVAHFQIRDPAVSIEERWRIVISIPNGRRGEFPIGSRILASPELRARLLAGKPG